MSSITAVPKGVVNVFINIFGNGKGGWQAIANSIAGVAVVLALKKAQKVSPTLQCQIPLLFSSLVSFFLSFLVDCEHIQMLQIVTLVATAHAVRVL